MSPSASNPLLRLTEGMFSICLLDVDIPLGAALPLEREKPLGGWSLQPAIASRRWELSVAVCNLDSD